MKLSQELIGILAVGVTLMGMLVGVFVSMGRMETRLRQDIGAVRGELHDQIGTVRGELRDQIGTVRDEMRILREDVRHDIDGLRADIQDIREDVRQLRDKLLVPAASPPASSPGFVAAWGRSATG